MKRSILTVLILTLATGLFAQAVPQPAFRLLDGYLDQRAARAEYGAKYGPWALIGVGVAAGATAAVIAYQGDSIAESLGNRPLNSAEKTYWVGGFALGSAVLTSVGVALKLFPITIDERREYSAIYQETDPALQELMAEARLKELAAVGRSNRVVSGIVNLGLAGASLTVKILANQDEGYSWNHDLTEGWGLGSIVGGSLSLFVRSPEEVLYDEYLYIIERSKR